MDIHQVFHKITLREDLTGRLLVTTVFQVFNYMSKLLFLGLVLESIALLLFIFGEKLFYSGAFVLWLFIAVPLFLAGVICVFASPSAGWAKAAISLWWIVIPLYHLLNTQINKFLCIPKVYLIDEKYRGAVQVCFHDIRGGVPILENSKAVIHIPSDGMVRSIFQLPQYPSEREQFGEWYYVNKTGQRKPILLETSDSSQTTRQAVVYIWRIDHFPDGKRISRIVFFIGTRNELQNWVYENNETFGS